jgi:hemerythrin-like domain-containing protein
MQARGPLMTEHRLIEKMIALIEKAVEKADAESRHDPAFIDTAADFIKVYADRTHHGKEEDILFRKLDKKDLSGEHRDIMNQLIEEHVFGRKTTRALVEANTRYREGDTTALSDIVQNLQTLVDFYPKHIEKEDKVFFPASTAYLDEKENRTMLEAFHDFDRRMIHEKYKNIVAGFDQ